MTHSDAYLLVSAVLVGVLLRVARRATIKSRAVRLRMLRYHRLVGAFGEAGAFAMAHAQQLNVCACKGGAPGEPTAVGAETDEQRPQII